MSLEDVARSSGSSDVADFLRIAHNDDGSLKPSALGGSLPVYGPIPSGDATGATDTAALQAAITKALEAGAKLVTSGYSALGVATPYYVNATLTITPPADSSDGFAYMDWEHHGYTKNSFIWVGANSGTMISAQGWKRSTVTGVKLSVTDGTAGVICWDIDTSVANPSTSFLTFTNCPVNLGTGINNIAWRLGQVSGGAADIDGIEWINCIVVGNNAGAPASGQTGWLDKGSNCLNLNWRGGGCNTCDVGFNITGNSSKFLFGFQFSTNNTDIIYSQRGSLVVIGGRSENGKRWLDGGTATNHADVTVTGHTWSNYAPSDGIIFNMARPGTLNLIDPYIQTSGSAYPAAMITLGGNTGQGALHIKGGAINAAQPFFTKSYSGWKVYLEGVGVLSSNDRSLTYFADSYPHSADVFQKALSLLAWNMMPLNLPTASAPTSQSIYAVAIPLSEGQIVSKLGFTVTTAGAGTAPTNIFVGLADSTGKMVAQTADVAADTAWTDTGIRTVSLVASYTVPSDGIYYVVFLQNGTWGTTAMQFGRTNTYAHGHIFGSTFVYASGGALQTTLPANGSSLTLTGGNGPLLLAVVAA
jgi:hypothetical protein